MSDSNPVDDIDLDAFSVEMFAPAVEQPEAKEEEITPEPTPSATEEESDPETVESEVVETGADTPESDDEPEEVEAEDQPKPKKKKPAQERIDELTRDKYDLQRRLDALEKVLAEREAKPAVETPEPTPVVTAEAPKPDAIDDKGEPIYPLGEFDPQFITDLTKFTIQQERETAAKEAEKTAQQKMVEEAQKQLTDKWVNDVAEATERLPNFQEKIVTLTETFSSLPRDYGDFLASSIMALDNGPDVLNYFAENLEEAKRVVAQGPFQATIALGRLDAKFAAERAKEVEREKVAPTTQAPPPPPKNKGSAVSKRIDPNDPDVSLDDFEKVFFK